MVIGTSPQQSVREVRFQVVRMWVVGRSPYVPAPIQEEVIRSLSDEETILYVCVSFAFDFMVYSDIPNERQPFQSVEIDSNVLVNMNFSCGCWLTVAHTAIRPIDRSQLDKDKAMIRVTEVGIPSMLQSLLTMESEDSIILEESPNMRLNKAQRTTQYTPANTIGGVHYNL